MPSWEISDGQLRNKRCPADKYQMPTYIGEKYQLPSKDISGAQLRNIGFMNFLDFHLTTIFLCGKGEAILNGYVWRHNRAGNSCNTISSHTTAGNAHKTVSNIFFTPHFHTNFCYTNSLKLKEQRTY